MKSSPLAIIILAAGKGTRMKSATTKVLHPVAGFPMVHHILAAAQTLNPQHTVVITGHQADELETYISKHFPTTTFARQEQQKGTGHAVMQAEKALKGFKGTILIAYADIFLNCRPDIHPTLLTEHEKSPTGLTMLAANLTDPTNFGRLFKKAGKWVNVEEKDCTPEQKKITTANPCIYAVESTLLWKLLKDITPNNAQKEYYLTDIIEGAAKAKKPVSVVPVPAERAEVGMNTRAEIAQMEALWQSRKRTEMMLAGVTLIDPATVYFSADTKLGQDVTIGQHVVFGPGVSVEDNVTIKPFSHLEGCHIRTGALIGPFARLRPGADVGENAHVGNFVEIKNSTLGKNSKANHLSYIGDATVGEDTNLGAGTITANYNHTTKQKFKTTIGDNVSVGSHSVLVAPVTLGNGVTVGASTTIRKDVEAGSLIVTLGTNKIKANYTPRAAEKKSTSKTTISRPSPRRK